MAARKDRAVVIEAAINGETRPEKNPHVPRTPEAISRDALTCLSAGAALIHAHNDDIRLWGRGAADRYLTAWRPVMKERPDSSDSATVIVRLRPAPLYWKLRHEVSTVPARKSSSGQFCLE